MESLLLPIVDFDSLGRPIKEEDFSCLSMSSPTEEDQPHSSPMGLESDLPCLDAESTSSPMDIPSTPTASILDDDAAPSSNCSSPPKRKRGSGGTKRKQVKRACSNCRKAHAGCDENRPCRRCVGGGKENSCKDVPRKKRSRSRTDLKEKTYKKDKKSNSILEDLDADELNQNINSAIENSRKRKRRGGCGTTHQHNNDMADGCSSDCQSSQGESDHNCESEYVDKPMTKKRRNLSQSVGSHLKREKSTSSGLSSSTSSIFSTHKIKSEHSPLDELDLSPSYSLCSSTKSENDNEGDNTEEENIFDSDNNSNNNNNNILSSTAASKQLVFSTFTNYGNILNPNNNNGTSNSSSNNNGNGTGISSSGNNWNINYGWDDGATMENKLQDLLGEVKYSLNYQQHSLSIDRNENGYGVEGLEDEEGSKMGILGTGDEEIGKSLDLNAFFGGEGEYLGGCSEENFYGWEEILNNS